LSSRLLQYVQYVTLLTLLRLGLKAPKGEAGYFVPILANPDIVSRYQENIVDTLHKKNLLLLGEDRYLSTLMLKTFPHRKQIFVPYAVCKTIVPNTFKVLLSQRRRWINSTVHNLMELVLVRDLCGTFCFSMQVHWLEIYSNLVCCLYRVGRDMCVACCNRLYCLCHCDRDRSTSGSPYPSCSTRSHSRITSCPHRLDSETMVLRRLDVDVSRISPRLESRPSSLRLLEF
jgi:hypothetical protein